jgi:hypothetical protein
VPSLVKIGSVILEKEVENVKFTDRQIDGQQAIRKVHLSF